MKLLILCLTALLTTPLQAQNISDVISLTLRPGWRAADGTHIAGLHVRLAPGWKTYWRQPGDAGIPPLFDWSAAQNVANVDVKWPKPKVTWILGQRSIGYYDEVVFPLHIKPNDNGPVHLAATVQLGVCEEICIPVMMQFSTKLAAKGRHDGVIQTALNAQIPAGAGQIKCRFTPTIDSTRIDLTVPQWNGIQPNVVVEIPTADAWIAEPAVTPNQGSWLAQTEVLTPSGTPTAIERSKVRTTVFYGDHAVEYMGCTAG